MSNDKYEATFGHKKNPHVEQAAAAKSAREAADAVNAQIDPNYETDVFKKSQRNFFLIVVVGLVAFWGMAAVVVLYAIPGGIL